MNIATEADDMSDREILYRLVDQVGQLKSTVTHQAQAQEVQWGKIDSMSRTLGEINGKIDTTLTLDGRLQDVEKGVKQYRSDRNRLFAWVSGLSIGAGVVSEEIASAFKNWFGLS